MVKMWFFKVDPVLVVLSFMRVSGFVFSAPVLGSKVVPGAIKVWFSLAIALVLAPVIKLDAGMVSLGDFRFFILAGREVLLGILIGFVCSLFVQGVEFAGHLVGLQMGFAASTLFDPLSRNQVSVIGRFQALLALVLFLLMNGHHVMLSTLAESYKALPPSVGGFSPVAGRNLITLTSGVFTLAVRISVPVLISLLMVETGLALLAKTVPQMNIFIVGFPVKIALGLTVLALSIPYFTYVLAKNIGQTESGLRSLLNALSGG